MSQLRSIDDLKLDQASVLVRTDFNVTIGSDGSVDDSEDYRIEAALPTIKELQHRSCKIIVATHLGRPEAGSVKWDLEPVKKRLENLIGQSVFHVDFFSGNKVQEVVGDLSAGDILMLPNVRLDLREEKNDKSFAEELVMAADFYVNEAFSNSHRVHASMGAAAKLRPACAGRRTIMEVEALTGLRDSPKAPYVAIISGAKIATKIGLLNELLRRVDQIFVAGRIANVFLQAVGKYAEGPFEHEDVKLAKALWQTAQNRIVLPVDVMAGPQAPGKDEAFNVDVDDIPPGVEGVWDVGPKTVELMLESAKVAETVLWNGPLGLCEVSPYDGSTVKLAKGLAEVKSFRVVGGGDTVNVLESLKIKDDFDHVSVGGGALVTFLEGKEMPGLVPLYV